ncbi:universal stress protein [Maricaulis sp.]|uniref:universal stress protein n=1 Tax=Maricaulis sp. TaxID=1486257 RepID=UPI000C4981CB|nr:universal stress protein [Maricaulis sp.]MAC89325.1 universal stress protein UspA [Maricaulis sp.]
MTKLILLVDGSAYGESVCDHAAWVAATLGAKIELLHVLGRRDTQSLPANLSGSLGFGAKHDLLDKLAAHDEERAKLAKERGRAILDAAAAYLTDKGVTDIALRLRHGDLVEALQQVEGDADLILIGKRGEAADFAAEHLGSNLERIVRAAHKPVMVASRKYAPVTRALIAFDGGASARKAVSHIAGGQLFKGIPLHLLTVGKDDTTRIDALESAAEDLRAAGHTVTTAIRAGDPDKVIVDYVEDEAISLLVMGAYGHSRMRNLVIGSTTTDMIRNCHIPVMLFR